MDMTGMSMGSVMDGMSMGSMSMGSGVPNLFYLQKIFWAVTGSVIGLAAAMNAYNKLLFRQRCA